MAFVKNLLNKLFAVILGVIGGSVAMVSAVYISLWVADLKKFSLPLGPF